MFVVSDEVAGEELRRFYPDANLYVHKSSIADVSYGTFEYFALTLERLQLQNQLIQAGVNVFLIEADAVWFSPIAEYMSGMIEVDGIPIIAATDRSSDKPLISAGFIYFSASVASFFDDYTAAYAEIVRKFEGMEGRLDHIHAGEQHLMTKMLRKRNIAVSWLDECHYARGEWYQDATFRVRCPHPKLIQNNYIAGNNNKISRAKEWKHWFLKDDGTCVGEMPLVNPLGDFKVECAAVAFLPMPAKTSTTGAVLELDAVMSQVDHVFYLTKKAESCSRMIFSASPASKVSCVVGEQLDECLFEKRELVDYAELVTAAHGFVHQYAHNKNFKHIAVLEEDATIDKQSLDLLLSQNNIQYLSRLIDSTEWNIIRFGRLPFFLNQVSLAGACPEHCLCRLVETFGESFCRIRPAGCDMRSSDFYISSSRVFLKLAELVNDDNRYPCQRIENRVIGVPMATPRPTIDLQVLQSIDKQWYPLPQASFQTNLRHLGVVHGHLDGVKPDITIHHQQRLDSLFVQRCVLTTNAG